MYTFLHEALCREGAVFCMNQKHLFSDMMTARSINERAVSLDCGHLRKGLIQMYRSVRIKRNTLFGIGQVTYHSHATELK